jgi:ABC-type cobalamin transport system permease subunit
VCLPILLQILVGFLDEHKAPNIILGLFLVLHSIIYLPSVLVIGHGWMVGVFSITLWGLVGFIGGFFLDKKSKK